MSKNRQRPFARGGLVYTLGRPRGPTLLLLLALACTEPASAPCIAGFSRADDGTCAYAGAEEGPTFEPDDSATPTETGEPPDSGDSAGDTADTAPAPGPKNVVVVVMDAGRWGLVDEATMPRLTSRIPEGVSVANMTNVAAWTRPTTAALMSGVRWDELGTGDFPEGMPDGVETLADRYHAAGYGTYLNSANAALWMKGYVHPFDAVSFPPQNAGLAEQAEMVRHFLELQAGPSFVWVQAMETHIPYGQVAASCVDDVVAAEAGCPIDVMSDPNGDASFGVDPFADLTPEQRKACGVAIESAQRCTATQLDGELDTFIESLGPETMVLVVSDHGEGWLDPQADHNWGTSQKLTRGFFLLLNSTMSPQVVPSASQVDVMPTLLRESGLPYADLGIEGVPLGDAPTHEASAWYCDFAGQMEVAVWEGDRQLLRRDVSGDSVAHYQLFDTEVDPEGDTDLYQREPPSATLIAAVDAKVERTRGLCMP